MRFAPAGKNGDQRAEAVATIRRCLGTRSVVLVGMPGSGKSAAGKRLAPRLELPFLDADVEIEKAAGKTITEIFKENGEPYFRDGERRVIARLLANGPSVIATGGGAFITEAVRENIREKGLSVWLRADLPLLLRRVMRRTHRPMLVDDPEGTLKRLIEARYPIYATADIVVEARDVPHEVMVNEIVDKVAAFLAAEPGKTLDASGTDPTHDRTAPA